MNVTDKHVAENKAAINKNIENKIKKTNKRKLYFLYSLKQLEKELYTNAKDKQQIIKEINRRINKKN